MSGAFVVAAAAHFPDKFSCAASFFGTRLVTDRPDSPHRQLKNIRTELYLGFAYNHELVPAKTVETFQRHLDAAGVSYELDKLKASHDFILVDTPPKVDSDLKPAIRESDLVVIPVSASPVDVWATEDVIDLVSREKSSALIVLNRVKSGTRVADDVSTALKGLGASVATAALGNRVAFAETLGNGKSVLEIGKGKWTEEIQALAQDVQASVK